MMGIRQPAFCTEAVTALKGDILPGGRAGLTAYYNHSAHYEIFLTRKEDGYHVCLGKQVGDICTVTEERPIAYNGSLRLKVTADREWYSFRYEESGEWKLLGRGMTAHLCTETTCTTTYTGTFIGIFAENTAAVFDAFTLTEKDTQP